MGKNDIKKRVLDLFLRRHTFLRAQRRCSISRFGRGRRRRRRKSFFVVYLHRRRARILIMGALRRAASSKTKEKKMSNDGSTSKSSSSSNGTTTTTTRGKKPTHEFKFALPTSSDERDKKWDVTIVGAGVAGASLACVLGNQGRKVLCVERDSGIQKAVVGELLQPG